MKRAGSPALSESSGTESSRKKMKTATTAPSSRAGTPLPNQPASQRSRIGGPGSGSDGEATVGDMSDGAGSRKNVKIVDGSRKGTPTVSRAGSPNPMQGGKPLP